MVTALENMRRYYNQRAIEPFKDYISVPGIAENIAFSTLTEDAFFWLFPKKDRDIPLMLQDQLVGGPAIVFSRYAERRK